MPRIRYLAHPPTASCSEEDSGTETAVFTRFQSQSPSLIGQGWKSRGREFEEGFVERKPFRLTSWVPLRWLRFDGGEVMPADLGYR